MPKHGVMAVLLPVCSPALQITVGSPLETSGKDAEILARNDSEGLVVTGQLETQDPPQSILQDLPFSELAYDLCGLSLRHLIATHPAVLDGSPVVAIDWHSKRLLLVGIRAGRTEFCSYRAVPRNLGNLTRELLRWNGEGVHVLLCGAGLQSPGVIVDCLRSPGLSIELLDPRDLLGIHLDMAEPWRYGLCISMALGWFLAKERDPFLIIAPNGRGARRSPWFGWVLPLALLAVGAAGFGVGEKARRAPAVVSVPVLRASSISDSLAIKAEMNWQRLLYELAVRMPIGTSLLAVHAEAGSEKVVLELSVRSRQEDGGPVLLKSLTGDELFHHGVVHEIRAHRQREQEETVFDCVIHVEAGLTR